AGLFSCRCDACCPAGNCARSVPGLPAGSVAPYPCAHQCESISRLRSTPRQKDSRRSKPVTAIVALQAGGNTRRIFGAAVFGLNVKRKPRACRGFRNILDRPDRSKNDANDAAAICEAVTRPSMRFVATKSEQQQSGLMLHRSRQLLVCQRTMLSNALRGHLAELGIISAKGRNGTAELLEIIADEQDDRIATAARFSLGILARQYAAVRAAIVAIEKRIYAWHRSCEESRRLEEIPGVGPIVATALLA